MKDQKYLNAILAIGFFFLGLETLHAATLSIDLDMDTAGIQMSRNLLPGDTLDIGIVYTGDGATQFDTFAFDVVHDTNNAYLHDPVAGAIADSAPMLAFDIYAATQVSSGDPLTRGSMPTPLGFEVGLGGVGISSLGGAPFALVGDDESVELFSASLTALDFVGGASQNLALTGYPFGVGAELSLAGEPVPVDLQQATIRVVPLPAAFWLFASGVILLLGRKQRIR
jgi:hypothetical protein